MIVYWFADGPLHRCSAAPRSIVEDAPLGPVLLAIDACMVEIAALADLRLMREFRPLPFVNFAAADAEAARRRRLL